MYNGYNENTKKLTNEIKKDPKTYEMFQKKDFKMILTFINSN